MTHYYIRNRHLGSLWTNEDGSLRLVGEQLKRATEVFMDAHKVNHIEFVSKEEYEANQREIKTYAAGTNPLD